MSCDILGYSDWPLQDIAAITTQCNQTFLPEDKAGGRCDKTIASSMYYTDIEQVYTPRQLVHPTRLPYTHLQVHVVVRGDQVTFVLHAPLQLGDDRFSSEAVQVRLGVDRHSLREQPLL